MKETLRAFLVLPFAFVALILALPIVVVTGVFWCVSAAVRYLPRLWQPPLIEWGEIIQYDSEVGWKPKPNLNTYHAVEKDDIYRVETDQEGWPGQTTTIEESDVVVFGDSFAFGYGTNPESSFSNLNSDIPVKAIGAPGYNMVQELLLMKQLSERLNNKLVVWFVYLENDLHDNLIPAMFGKYRCPFVRRGGNGKSWEIVTSHLNQSPWSSGPTTKRLSPFLAKLCTPCELSERAYSACSYLIEEAQKVVRAAGAELAIVTIPYSKQLPGSGLESLRSLADSNGHFDPDYPDKVIGDICSGLDIPFRASKRVLSPGDFMRFETYHWTSTGHQKAAQLIKELFDTYQVKAEAHVVQDATNPDRAAVH